MPTARLKAPRDFELVYRSGRRSRADAVTVIAAIDDATPPRLAVTCSRKVGNAVVRNRAKRRLRAASRELTLRDGSVVVLQATPDTPSVNFQNLEATIRDSLSHVGALVG